MFYPAAAGALRAQIEGFLHGAQGDHAAPKAIIAPHAGYIYSGTVAAAAYATLAPARARITRVVLLGPAHRVHVRGLAASSADYFRTPLGDVPVDRAAVDALTARLPSVQVMDNAHAPEHSLEVQLPFLQLALNKFALVPLVVGDASVGEVVQVLEFLWGGPETLIVVSSDLSHYHDYATAQQMDAATSRAIEALDADALDMDQACGRIPVCGLLQAARAHGLHASTLDLRNSGDTAGPRDQVVGYGAYLFA